MISRKASVLRREFVSSHSYFMTPMMAAALTLPENHTIDVHTHAIPKIWKEALISSGYAAEGT
jgi:predicted RNA binding protein YcfA (HicA-like mRNA interferase family)